MRRGRTSRPCFQEVSWSTPKQIKASIGPGYTKSCIEIRQKKMRTNMLATLFGENGKKSIRTPTPKTYLANPNSGKTTQSVPCDRDTNLFRGEGRKRSCKASTKTACIRSLTQPEIIQNKDDPNNESIVNLQQDCN